MFLDANIDEIIDQDEKDLKALKQLFSPPGMPPMMPRFAMVRQSEQSAPYHAVGSPRE